MRTTTRIIIPQSSFPSTVRGTGREQSRAVSFTFSCFRTEISGFPGRVAVGETSSCSEADSNWGEMLGIYSDQKQGCQCVKCWFIHLYMRKTNKNKAELAFISLRDVMSLKFITQSACRPVLKIIHQEVKYCQQISLVTVKMVFTGLSFPYFSWVWLLVCVCFADGVTVGSSGSTNPSWNWKVNSQPIWKHHTFFFFF